MNMETLFYLLFASFIVLLYAEPSKLANELVEMNLKIGQMKSEIINSIGKANEAIEMLDGGGNELKQLEDISNAEVAIESMHKFVTAMSPTGGGGGGRMDLDFLIQEEANLVYLKEKLQIHKEQQEQNAKTELENLKEELVEKIGIVKKMWQKNGANQWKKNGIKPTTQIVEMKVKIELINLMGEANLHMCKEYETLVMECAKFENEKGAKTEGHNKGEPIWAQIVENSQRNFVQKLINKFDNTLNTLPNPNQKIKPTVDKLKKYVKQIGAGEMPSGEEMMATLQCNLAKVSKISEKYLGIDWQKINDVHTYNEMSDWRLAMHGNWALISFFKIGIVSRVEEFTQLISLKQQHRQRGGGEGDDDDGNTYERNNYKYKKWLTDNAPFFKAAYGRLFPQIDDDHQQKRRRRRRKRGAVCEKSTNGGGKDAKQEEEEEEVTTVNCFGSIDWEAWLMCVSRLLFVFIIVVIVIAALIAIVCGMIACFTAASGGGGGGGECDNCCNDCSGGGHSHNNDCCCDGGSSDNCDISCCCCCDCGNSSSNRSNYGGYSGYGSSRAAQAAGLRESRPELSYWNACSVVWYDWKHRND